MNDKKPTKNEIITCNRCNITLRPLETKGFTSYKCGKVKIDCMQVRGYYRLISDPQNYTIGYEDIKEMEQ